MTDEIKRHRGRPYTLTRQEAANEIEAADDPELFEMACEVAIKALRNDVPRENIEAMVAEILIKDLDRTTSGEKPLSATECAAIIRKYTDQGGEHGKT